MANFPTSLPALSNPTATTKLGTADTALKHASQHANANDEIEAIATKIGISGSTPSSGTVLHGSGTGTSAWAALATGDVAANAITQNGLAVGVDNNPTTTSTTYADLTNLSVTLTTVGGDLVVWASHSVGVGTLGKATWLAILLDSGTEVAERVLVQKVAAYQENIATHHRFTGVTAGSHTVKARWKVDSGETATSYSGFRTLLVVELKK